MLVTRGFSGKRRSQGVVKERVPPGQFVTPEFPVLTAGPTPRTPLDSWTMALQHGGRLLARWTWAEFNALPQTEITTDIHCVTKWSKLDTRWRGVTFDELIKAAGLTAAPTPFVLAHCDGGYTTNVPVAEMIEGKAMVATHFDGLPLLTPHGGPARLLVPHLYFWKSAKWLRRITFRPRGQSGRTQVFDWTGAQPDSDRVTLSF